MVYAITCKLPIGGNIEGLTYRLAIGPSSSRSGFVFNLEAAHFGGTDKIGIVEAASEPELLRVIHQIGFDTSGMTQLTLDHLVERTL